MPIHNLMEQLVGSCLKEYMVRHVELQNLDEGKFDDIMAITLNRLPAKYVSTEKGEVFAKTQLRTQLESDVYKELSYAIEKVTSFKRESEFN
ncbi:MAG: late competence development ComFB family protein [Paenibacillaceae bacterium]